ncbi:MAG: hypothetical protein HY096_08005 [Nitrospinae bacterium]|nr:hypothetical protein [Nitrospinota bacterium]
MDAKEISKKVRDYFFEVHGQYAVFGFRIEDVSFDKKSNAWKIESSLLQSVLDTEEKRVYYEVIIDSQGKFKNVKKVAKKKQFQPA